MKQINKPLSQHERQIRTAFVNAATTKSALLIRHHGRTEFAKFEPLTCGQFGAAGVMNAALYSASFRDIAEVRAA